MSALWMTLLLAFLGVDLLGIGISEKYAIDIVASVVCWFLAMIALLCHLSLEYRSPHRKLK